MKKTALIVFNLILLVLAGACVSLSYKFQHPQAPRFCIISSTDNNMEITISSDPFAKIYYTLDGSIPDENSYLLTDCLEITNRSNDENLIGGVYKNVIEKWADYSFDDDEKVPKGTIINAIAISPSGYRSKVSTQTFFPGVNTSGNVLSIVADPEDLFGPGGIYSTGWQYDDWYTQGADGDAPALNYNASLSIPANMELTLSNVSINQPVTIKIQGNSSRSQIKKNFKIIADRDERTPYFESTIFEDINSHSLMFRSISSEAIMKDLLEGRNLSCQSSIPVQVYLNGDFMYNTYLMERFDKYYFDEHYGVKDAFIIKDGDASNGGVAAQTTYDEMMDWVRENDFSDEMLWDELKRKIDIQSYADFIITNTYICNMDMSESKNYICWRSKNDNGTEYNDGKWRWCIYDVDFLEKKSLAAKYDVPTKAQVDSVNLPYPYTNRLMENDLFLACLENPEFHEILQETLDDMMNTSFSKDHVLSVLQNHNLPGNWNESFFDERPLYIRTFWASVIKKD